MFTLKTFFTELLHFIYKQAFACLFGGFIIFIIIVTRFYYPLEEIIYQYDFLFLLVLIFQIILILTKFETWKEAGIILIFHITAMVMEIFKTNPNIGSWSYPGNFVLGIFGVPLFAGFMYSAVGSYISRVWKIFEFRYTNYPKKLYTILIAIGIYINFFTHHFILDFRYILIGLVILTFGRSRIYFKPHRSYHSMNLAFGFFLVAIFIWIAENIATFMRIWIYPSQAQIWHMVGFEKITAWFLLMIISFVLVSLLHKPQPYTK